MRARRPTMIRPRKRKTEPAAPPRLLFALARSRFYWKLQRFPAPAIIPNFTKCCTCHKKWHMNFTKCCTCHKKWPMNSTKCCGCHEKWHMNFTKCCACHKKWHMNFTKCCACHAKWISWLIHITYETSFTMRGATVNTLQPHQILRLPRKMTTQHLTEICWKQLKRHFQCATDPSMIREYPTMIRPRQRKTEPAAPPRLLFALARSRFYWKLQRFPLRLSFQISPHAAPATKSDTWTSPNAAPATKSDKKWHMTTATTTAATTTTTYYYYY